MIPISIRSIRTRATRPTGRRRRSAGHRPGGGALGPRRATLLVALLLATGLAGATPGPALAQETPPAGEDRGRGDDRIPDRDDDADGALDLFDNCVGVPNPDQADLDDDGLGDACDAPPDADLDGAPDGSDNCALVPNPDQLDADADGLGDACDDPTGSGDADADAVADSVDSCPAVANPDPPDSDADGVGDACAPTPSPAPTAPARPTGRETPTPVPTAAPPGAPGEGVVDGPVPLVGGLAVPAPGQSLVAVSVPLVVARLDAGGEGIGEGERAWSADAHYEEGKGGGKAVTAIELVAIADTEEDDLYASERRSTQHKGAFGYQIPVPAADTYTVRLHLAELYWGAPGGGAGEAGQRVFDVNAEGGAAELEDYDIFAAVGALTATVEEFEVAVTDGVLDLRFRASAGRPTVAAIEVLGDPVWISVPADGGGGLLAPGSGIAIATGSTAIRPSPGAASIATLAGGSAVLLTGIDSSGFYYVNYAGGLGWVDAGALALPANVAGSTFGAGGAGGDMAAIIADAAARYGQPEADMLRVAGCESGLNPNAINPAGSYGLFQFVATTWASTPYAAYSIFDPWASANAAGWMWSVGRRGEWVCQ